MILTFPYYHRDPSKIDFTIDCIINLDKHDYPEIDDDGNKRWFNSEGQRHRLDGPAEIYSNGTQWYYQNGNLHNENGPAVIYPSGTQHYCQNNQRHRLDGPAVIRINGEEEYWEYDKFIK